MQNLPDLVLVAHFVFVFFVLGGFVGIWIGAWRGWHWVRNPFFRTLHLAAILFVALISLFGCPCPLTILEDRLRGATTGQPGFIARQVSWLLYYDLPEWVFTLAYVLFAAVVALSFHLVPPARRRKKG